MIAQWLRQHQQQAALKHHQHHHYNHERKSIDEFRIFVFKHSRWWRIEQIQIKNE